MVKEYRYDAFISYRHSDIDSFVATNVHKYLETYKLPKNIQEKLNIKGRSIKRIFRDQDELPLASNLNDPIVEALKSSKYLIVICSPRLRESVWCKKEIETFKKLKGRENIFCILAEGEPDQSFPEEVLYDYKTVTGKDGKSKKEKQIYEPLAADVRGDNKKEILKKIKSERLRLIAPMFNLNYDDLKQRHRQRKIRKTIFTLSMVTIGSFILALYSAFMLLKISHQQKVLKLHQANSLVKESEDYLAKDSKYNAVKSSYEALTKFKGVKMPYTTDAEYQLVESLNIYNAGLSYYATNEMKTKGIVDYIKTSTDHKYILSYDESEELNLWNAENFKKIKTFNGLNGFSFSKTSFSFVGNSKITYIDNNGSVVLYDISKNKVLDTIKKDNLDYTSLIASANGKYISYHDDKYIYLYDVEKQEVASKTKTELELQKMFKFTPDGEYIIAMSNSTASEVIEGKTNKLYIYNVNDFNNYKSISVKADYLENIVFNGSIAYALLNNSEGITDNNILVIGFNYKNADVKFTKKIDDAWGKSIDKLINDKHQSIAISHNNEVILISPSDGKTLYSYSVIGEVLDIYSFNDNNLYLSFQKNGNVSFINPTNTTNITYNDLFNFNAGEYILIDNTSKGYLLVPKNSNRIIYYEKSDSRDLKEAKGKYKLLTSEGITLDKYDDLKKEYNVDKKNMIREIIYSKNKDIIIFSYVDNTANIYSVKTKKKLSTIKNVGIISNYIGKDKYGRTYVGNLTDSYILDKDYNKVGHIRNLNSIDNKNNKLVIYRSDNYYTLPIYSFDDLLDIAKEYLNNK